MNYTEAEAAIKRLKERRKDLTETERELLDIVEWLVDYGGPIILASLVIPTLLKKDK